MTNAAKLDMPNDALLEEAAGWLTRLHEQGTSTTPEFEAWRGLSPEHEEAWVRAEAPWKYLGDHAAAPELIARRGAALQRARSAARARWSDRRAHFLRPRALAAAVALATALSAGLLYVRELPTTYRTDTGERRVVRLDDGSVVSLDSQSEVSVCYTKHSRDLVLVRGQGRFDVAHDIERPFSVAAGDRKVIATGTSFDVDLVGAEVVVTLIEGRVVVLDRQSQDRGAAGSAVSEEGVKLQAGERLVESARLKGPPRAAPAIQRVNVERATAWQSGQLVFDDETLAAAVERVNRYSRSKISVTDPSAADMRFSGVFNEGDTRAFVDTVTRYLSLSEQSLSDGTVELRRRD